MRTRLLLGLALCAGCADVGLGAPGGGTPPPAPGVPADRIIEGGAQVRISPTGMDKILAGVRAALARDLPASICVPKFSLAVADGCYRNDGTCAPGCNFAVSLELVSTSFTDARTVQLLVQTDVSASVPIRGEIASVPFTCTTQVSRADAITEVGVGLAVHPATGELSIGMSRLDLDAGDWNVTGCPAPGNLRDDVIQDALEGFAGSWALAVQGAVQAAVASAFPQPTELSALVDLAAFALTGPAGRASNVEVRLVPGGYAQLFAGGLSAGVITGFNHDAVPSTREGGAASEPDPCVAGLSAPDLSGLPATPRGTHALPPAGTMLGAPEAAADLLVGISESALDLAGNAVAASGGLCLDLRRPAVAPLHRDALHDLLGLPLAASDADLRLSIAPTRPLDFTVGDDPHVTAHLPLRIEIGEAEGATELRVEADVSFGLSLVPRVRDQGPVALELLRSAPSVTSARLETIAGEYAGADPRLAAAAADLALSALGQDTGPFLVPGAGGLPASGVQVQRVTTTSDDLVGVLASLGTGDPPGTAAPEPVPVSTTVSAADPAAVRAAVASGEPTGLPEVVIRLPESDLEHSWRTPGGAWHPYARGDELRIRDRTFAWQGEWTIDLVSRHPGDESTRSPVGRSSFRIDWAPPEIFEDAIRIEGEELVVPARDAVSPVERALGREGEAEPSTPWTSSERLDVAAALALGNVVRVHARDEDGHVATASVRLREDPPTGGSGGGGAGGSGGGGGAGGSGGSAPAAGGSGGGGSGPGPTADGGGGASEGCGCGSGGAAGLLAWPVLVALRRRRRGRGARGEESGG